MTPHTSCPSKSRLKVDLYRVCCCSTLCVQTVCDYCYVQVDIQRSVSNATTNHGIDSSAVDAAVDFIAHGTDIVVSRILMRKTLNGMTGVISLPPDLLGWLRSVDLLPLACSNARAWPVDVVRTYLERRFPGGVGLERVNNLFGALPGITNL
jgi:hypothetical protein